MSILLANLPLVSLHFIVIPVPFFNFKIWIYFSIYTLQSALATICVCLCKHNSSWLASYIHGCTNETHSIYSKSQDLNPTLAS